MKIFKRNKLHQYQVVKFYKLVDNDQAKLFDFKSYLKTILFFIESQEKQIFDNFSLNYSSKTWKSSNGFFNALKNIKNNDIVDVLCFKNKTMLSISNNLLNTTEKTLKDGVIEICLSIQSENFSLLNLIDFLNDTKSLLDIDYGYVFELDSSYDFYSEKQISNSLFSTTTKLDKYIHIWDSHIKSINKGFMKNIYSINFLNMTQINLDIVKNLISDQVGKVNPINENITCWELTLDEMYLVREAFNGTKFLIGTKSGSNVFLNTEEAKYFKSSSKLKWNQNTQTYE
jgi:hypothetical protein